MNEFLILTIFLISIATVIACLAMVYRRKRQREKEEETQQVSSPVAIQPTEKIEPLELPPTTAPEALNTMKKASECTTPQEASYVEGSETQSQTDIEEQIATSAKKTNHTLIEGAQPTSTKPSTRKEVQPQVMGDLGSTKQQQISANEKEQRREPIKIGGRPRGSTKCHGEERTQKKISYSLKPEIICWKRERKWFVRIEVSDDLLEDSDNLEIYQNGQPLSLEEETYWLLHSIYGPLVVRYRGEDFPLTFGQRGYLLFKLSGKALNQGRLVKSLSSGSYLVVAPETWEIDETVAPEPVDIKEYLAYFFEFQKGTLTQIVFRTSEGKPISITPGLTRFEFIGERLEESTENIGPLFSNLPKIQATDSQVWKEIKAIVLGEEGIGKGKWRKQFSPNLDRADQELPSEIPSKRGGWYFIRIYDSNDYLVESLDFRFLSGLHEIKLPDSFPLPSNGGHKPAVVQLIHDPEINFRLLGETGDIQIERETDRTTIKIPPDPRFDKTYWQADYKDEKLVEITILVERIWWALGEEGNEPLEWKDKPLVLSRDDFTAISKRAIWLRFPQNRWGKRIHIGFDNMKRREYPVQVTERTLAIPLREFADTKEVSDLMREHQLRVWIERNSTFEGVVAILQSSQIIVSPRQQWDGVGKYKTAIAKARLQDGSGKIIVNDLTAMDYFEHAPFKARRFLQRLQDLCPTRDVLSHLDVKIDVWGSSPTTMRQAKAVAHALARALMNYQPKLKPFFKQEGFGGVKVLNKCPKNRRNER